MLFVRNVSADVVIFIHCSGCNCQRQDSRVRARLDDGLERCIRFMAEHVQRCQETLAHRFNQILNVMSQLPGRALTF